MVVIKQGRVLFSVCCKVDMCGFGRIPFTDGDLVSSPSYVVSALVDTYLKVKKIETGLIYDCTVNDVITSYMHTITI